MARDIRGKLLAIRFSDIEYGKIREMAEKQDITVSELVRKLVLERLDTVKDYVSKSTFGKISELKKLKESIADLYSEYCT
jgi:hypothetical protein